MWLALIMAFNVWFIIWPNQKKVLGLVEASADEKAAAARLAGMTSRINTMLSIPDALLHGGAAERGACDGVLDGHRITGCSGRPASPVAPVP